jgi:hypothetical protein
VDELEWVRDYAPGGRLDKLQPAPTLDTTVSRLRRALDAMHADQDPALDAFDQDGRAGTDFYRTATHAMLAVDQRDHEVIRGKARSGADWAQLCATPAKGADRRWALLRIGGKLLHHRVDEPMVLAQLLTHNRTMCLPPLQPAEVELLWRSIADRGHR